MITVGIDVGSITTKAAVVEDGNLISDRVMLTGYNAQDAGTKVYEDIIADLGIKASAVDKIIATGYGRKSVVIADKAVTEITCHAVGAHYLNPAVRSIIDIGGQDSKAIVVDENGGVMDFAMNDKCAAGTGRFLEVMARALEVDINDFGGVSLQADTPAKISSLCTVFAESEIVSLLAHGTQVGVILRGLHRALDSRVTALVHTVGIKAPLMLSGGVVQNPLITEMISEELQHKVLLPQHPQLVGAYGAALLAASDGWLE